MAEEKRDYYEVLELDRECDENDIKKSFRKLAKKYHPDRNSAKDAAANFAEVNEAYGVLSDPEKRANYDRYGHEGIDGAPGFGFAAEEVFSSFFDTINESGAFNDLGFDEDKPKKRKSDDDDSEGGNRWKQRREKRRKSKEEPEVQPEQEPTPVESVEEPTSTFADEPSVEPELTQETSEYQADYDEPNFDSGLTSEPSQEFADDYDEPRFDADLPEPHFDDGLDEPHFDSGLPESSKEFVDDIDEPRFDADLPATDVTDAVVDDSMTDINDQTATTDVVTENVLAPEGSDDSEEEGNEFWRQYINNPDYGHTENEEWVWDGYFDENQVWVPNETLSEDANQATEEVQSDQDPSTIQEEVVEDSVESTTEPVESENSDDQNTSSKSTGNYDLSFLFNKSKSSQSTPTEEQKTNTVSSIDNIDDYEPSKTVDGSFDESSDSEGQGLEDGGLTSEDLFRSSDTGSEHSPTQSAEDNRDRTVSNQNTEELDIKKDTKKNKKGQKTEKIETKNKPESSETEELAPLFIDSSDAIKDKNVDKTEEISTKNLKKQLQDNSDTTVVEDFRNVWRNQKPINYSTTRIIEDDFQNIDIKSKNDTNSSSDENQIGVNNKISESKTTVITKNLDEDNSTQKIPVVNAKVSNSKTSELDRISTEEIPENYVLQISQQQDLDIIYQARIPQILLFNNSTRRLSYLRNIPCEVCDATGADISDPNALRICFTCHNKKAQVENCMTCNGYGRLINKPCIKCKGKSYLKEQIILDINLPITDKLKLKVNYPGFGHIIDDKTKGNLIVNFIVSKSKLFKLDKNNIWTMTLINNSISTKGGEVFVPTLKQLIKVKLDPGTKVNDQLIIKEQGLPARYDVVSKTKYKQGDLIIRVIEPKLKNKNGRRQSFDSYVKEFCRIAQRELDYLIANDNKLKTDTPAKTIEQLNQSRSHINQNNFKKENNSKKSQVKIDISNSKKTKLEQLNNKNKTNNEKNNHVAPPTPTKKIGRKPKRRR
ncbi:terminal organelle assembly protein TopJ [[Mycoplasma] testudinis]|uniref:terminal organelle assembly protein TopJ n=1 Tax=[Mycoplasma] testudinis TaxID=33924 RepID=UPI0006964FB7|nr:terminal organelle assembly protein TopJ [[Mycoplasma] testudinis]